MSVRKSPPHELPSASNLVDVGWQQSSSKYFPLLGLLHECDQPQIRVRTFKMRGA